MINNLLKSPSDSGVLKKFFKSIIFLIYKGIVIPKPLLIIVRRRPIQKIFLNFIIFNLNPKITYSSNFYL